MKVLIINAHILDTLGGSELQCDLIAKGLVAKGHEVVYAAVGKVRLDKYPSTDYPVVPLDLSDKNTVGSFLGKEIPDVVYWRFNKKNLKWVVKSKTDLSIPMIFAVSNKRDVVKYSYTPKKNIKFLRRWLNYAKQLWLSAENYQYVCQSDAITVLNSKFLNQLPVTRQATIWNAAPLGSLPFTWERPFVVWVANLKVIKRPEIYLELAQHFSKISSLEVDFLMIGDIQEEIPYRALVDRASKLKNFHYLGKQSPEFVNGVLAKAICLVHTCEPEGFGNNFIQAWLQGCPTISLDHDPDDLIKEQSFGKISGILPQMKEDLLELITNIELRDEYSANAKRFSYQNFTPNALTDRIESFLLETVRIHENENNASV